MSKLSNAVAKQHELMTIHKSDIVTNFMGGDSYVINPLDTLKMVTASSIYGEPSYYRNSRIHKTNVYEVNPLITDVILSDEYEGMSTEEVIETTIDKALTYDFQGTICWAIVLRKEFHMRLNPQIIMVRAALHPNRAEFTSSHPGLFDEINQCVMSRADEPMTQMAYYMFNNNGDKKNMPSILKRSWAKKLSGLDRYAIAKYKNHEIGMINAVRISHANSSIIDELMTTGTVEVPENEKTWENLRSAGKSWREIFETIDMGHMALLRNIRGVFTEIDDIKFCKKYCDKLKDGVTSGQQFPFRYYSALKSINNCDTLFHKSYLINMLEECMDKSLDNYPKLKGKTMCLSDNSGSAWNTFNSEFGTVTIAEIDNLSSVITAACAEDGYVGKFGNTLEVHPISVRRGILEQATNISRDYGKGVGLDTEGGIWEFFKYAIDKKEHWDNIFIYSDMQAGHAQLYGTHLQRIEYSESGYNYGSNINVYKLICDYRKLVNPKVNVFMIQTAGYNNILVPEMSYRTAIQYGWTGKEAVFAQEYIRQWDEIEHRNRT